MTYLIKDNTAYFFSREVRSNPYPQEYSLHYFMGNHPLEMIKEGIVRKVVDTPFNLKRCKN